MIFSVLEGDSGFIWEVFGLVTNVPEYRLAWGINKNLSISLQKQPDFILPFPGKKQYEVSYYDYIQEEGHIRLVKNKFLNSQLNSKPQFQFAVPEFKNYDYFILKEGFDQTFEIEDLKSRLMGIPFVQLSAILKVEKQASQANLQF